MPKNPTQQRRPERSGAKSKDLYLKVLRSRSRTTIFLNQNPGQRAGAVESSYFFIIFLTSHLIRR